MSDLAQRQRRFLAPGVSTYYPEPLVLIHGEGRHVFSEDGTSYLDFFGGILTVSIGHAHPRVTEAVSRQAQKLVHTSTLYITEPMVNLAERLSQWTGLDKSFFTTSGTEANETAVSMAQLATNHSEVIAFRHSYSGRSQMAMGLTGQSDWKTAGAGMTLPIRHAHNAYCYRCPFGQTPDRCGLECAQDLKEFIKTSTSGRIAAVIAEPIQGVGGFITPPKAFFAEVMDIASQYGALFIDDEVQTGFGRTGLPFGIDHYGVKPDIMTFAKGLANGLPIGATIARDEIAQHYQGPTISTFGGNPLSMVAAMATLEVIEEDQLTDNAKVRGQELRAGLEALSDEFPFIGDVRGLGLMQGLEFVWKDKEPAPQLATEFLNRTRSVQLLVGKGGLYGNVIRIAPPLTVTAHEIQEGLRAMRQVLEDIRTDLPKTKEVQATRIQYQ